MHDNQFALHTTRPALLLNRTRGSRSHSTTDGCQYVFVDISMRVSRIRVHRPPSIDRLTRMAVGPALIGAVLLLQQFVFNLAQVLSVFHVHLHTFPAESIASCASPMAFCSAPRRPPTRWRAPGMRTANRRASGTI